MIACSGLQKSYAKPVLCGVDLNVGPGICAVLGKNGAGKSTLLRIVAGMERADQGSVQICGMTFDKQGIEIRQRMGCLPEGLGLFESLTVLENVIATGPIYGLTKRETGDRAEDLLRLLDLTQGRHTPARECSFGMRKKTALAMALLYKPQVMVLDEPFEGVDAASSVAIETLLRTMASDGATIVLTSHILPLVQRVADRVIVLADGQVAAEIDMRAMSEPVEAVYCRVTGGASAEVPRWISS